MARGLGSLARHLLPFPPEFVVVVPAEGREVVAGVVEETMGELDVRWQYRRAVFTGVGFAAKNVWSRSARRERRILGGKTESGDDSMDESEDEEPALGFRVQLKDGAKSNENVEGSVVVEIRWLVGHDSVLFESFCGMLKRTLLGK